MKKIALSCFVAAAALNLAGVANAEFVLQLPLGAKATYSKDETTLAPRVPVSTFGPDGLRTEVAPKIIRRTVWSFGGEQTLAEVEENILAQLQGSGYDILLFCQTDSCGGFDFRFAIDVVDEPEMRVDLRDYRFLSAKQAVTEQPAYVTFLLSKSPSAVYVQMTEYSPKSLATQVSQPVEALEQEKVPPPNPDIAELGSFVLEGLVFETGSAQLGGDPERNLEALAVFLSQNETVKVLLVGHSDMSGSLDGNIALSEKRARSVKDILAEQHGIAPSRISVYGVGFLSPRASNETEAGKQKNRRIEAVFSE